MTIIMTHRSTMYVEAAIVTDGTAWSVGLSQSRPLQKPLNRWRSCLGCGLGWAQGTTYYMGVQISHAETLVRGKEAAHCKV